jgi:hypothetical protein
MIEFVREKINQQTDKRKNHMEMISKMIKKLEVQKKETTRVMLALQS